MCDTSPDLPGLNVLMDKDWKAHNHKPILGFLHMWYSGTQRLTVKVAFVMKPTLPIEVTPCFQLPTGRVSLETLNIGHLNSLNQVPIDKSSRK